MIKQRGFSLIEVMVALAVVAISLGGIIKAVGDTANREASMGGKTFARWVAMNQVATAKLEHAWPRIGETKGTEEMAGGNWVWKQKTLATQDDNVKRIEISVWREGHEKNSADAFVVGFLTK